MKGALDRLGFEIRSDSKKPAMLSNAAEKKPTAGLATEVIRTASLKQAARHCNDAYQREHVTPVLYSHAEYSVTQIDDDPEHYTGPGMAVDTLCDYKRLSAISDVDNRVDIPTREAIALAMTLQNER
jgi:spore coat polysaccharide biosynthesis protein SpsF (cytidylyltransferase family)